MIIFIALLLFMYGLRVFMTQRYQLFGKRAVYGGDARNAAILFILPFVAVIMSIGFGTTNAAALVNLANLLSYVFLIFAGAVLAYTAFIAPDATLEHGSFELSDTVTTATAASYMKTSEQDVIDLIQSGILQARHVGNEYRIHKEVLIGYFETKQELTRNAA